MVAVCQYAGVAFTALYKTRISVRPIPDDVGRTIVTNEVALQVDGKIVAQPTDTTMEAIRTRLTTMGGELIYTGKGYPLHVNGDSEVKDSRWGPIPEIMDFVPLGGDCNAANLTWRVKTHIPYCDSAKYENYPMAMNFDVTHRIDRDNYSVEDISGYIEIPMTRTATGAVPDTVDRYRELLESDVPLGFRREGATWHTSADRRRLDFAWSDVELPQALPEWISGIDARHTMRSTLKDGFKIWTMTITANITVPRGVVRSHSLMALRYLVIQRTMTLQNQGYSIIPQVMEFTENIFGRDSSFSWVAMVLPPTKKNMTMGQTLNFSRLWYPIGSDFARWRKSLADVRANTTRGWADLRVPSDVIVDLCDTGATQDLVSVSAAPPNKAGKAPDDKAGDELQLKARNLQPDNSWLRFELDASFEEDARTIRHKLLPADPPDDFSDSARRVSVEGDRRVIDDAVGAPGSQVDSADDDVFQRIGKPSRVLVLTGWATRIGYRIPTPKIESIGDVAPVELSRQVREKTIGSMAGQPVYRAIWRIVYGLPKAPTGPYPTLANPTTDTDGGQKLLEGFTTRA